MKSPILTFSFIFCFLFFNVNHVQADEIEQLIAELKKQKKQIEKEDCPPQYDISNIDSVKQKIDCLYKIDQYTLNHTLNYYQQYKALQDYLSEIGQTSGEEIKKIVAHHGWPVISKFGKKTDFQAWLLVQHAEHDPLFQAAVAFLLGQLVEKGETSKKNYPYLFDRVMLKYQSLGLKQKYGTQYRIDNDDMVLQPHEGTVKEININRKKMGLGSVETELKRNKEFYLSATPEPKKTIQPCSSSVEPPVFKVA